MVFLRLARLARGCAGLGLVPLKFSSLFLRPVRTGCNFLERSGRLVRIRTLSIKLGRRPARSTTVHG